MRLQVWMKIGLICLLLAPAWTVRAAEPLRADIGAFGGVDVFSSKGGLGNAANPKDIPGAGGLVGLRGGVVLLDNRLGVEAEFRSAFSSMQSGSGSATVYGLRIQGLWYFLTEGKVQPFALAGFGKEVLTTSKKYVLSPDWDNAGWLGVGARSPITHRVAVRADVRYLIGEPRPKDPGAASSNGPTSNFEGTLGVAYSFGGAPDDSDHDGIADDVDKCPNEPEDKDGFQDADGCPDPDNDGDGILDAADKCPNDAEDFDGFQDEDGCPDPDNDKDGIPDVKDKCPNQAEDHKPPFPNDGCPSLDDDGDGIPNDKDKCPNEKEDKDGFQDDDGCPDPDNDKDGIPDVKDKCPNDPETKNGLEDEDGCPDNFSDAVAALLAKPTTAIEWKGVQLQKSADSVIEPLLETMLEHESLRIALSVDPEADSDAAKHVAEQRAASLLAWFEEHGIEATRVLVKPSTTVTPGPALKAGKPDPKAAAHPPVAFHVQ